MEAWTFTSLDAEQTRDFGVELGRVIGAEGIALALVGPLGAGKTVFVKGLAEGLGVDPRVVSSPTFVIAQQYAVPEGPAVLHHVDLYRLETEEELESIGFFDLLSPGSVVAVEWADRFPGVLGREVLEIHLEGPSVAEADAAVSEGGEQALVDGGAEMSPSGRGARVVARGGRAQQILRDWAEKVDHTDGAAGHGDLSAVDLRASITLAVAIALLFAVLLGDGLDFDEREAAAPNCAHPQSIESDSLGSRRVFCVAESSAPLPDFLATFSAFRRGEPQGLARLLFGERIDVNDASPELLNALPGIGPVRARSIAEAGPFKNLADLEKVSGIGPKTRVSLERWLEVEAVPAASLSAAEARDNG